MNKEERELRSLAWAWMCCGLCSWCCRPRIRRRLTISMSVSMGFGGLATPAYLLGKPQEELLERYFHPGHMSSAEKMKLELQRVRDEFKMSEDDCGPARVQGNF